MAAPIEPNREAEQETEQTGKANLNDSGLSPDQIAHRAYALSLTDEAGSDEENWHRAERELREEAAAQERA